MKILLVQPPLPANLRHKRVLPLGLAYLASFLRENLPELEIQILDALVLDIYYFDIMQHIKNFRPDIVGITFWSAQASFSYKLASGIKKLSSKIIVVFGGIHTTCCPEEAAEFADYCVLHEGEETFKELVECIEDGSPVENIQGIAYKKNGEIIKTPPRELIENLDNIPHPAWDLLPIKLYDTPLHVVGGRRFPVIGSRGCPYNCSYCVSPFMWGRRVRWRSVSNVVEELNRIIETYNVNQFHFWDDNLLMNKEYIKNLCLEIIKNNLDIKWVGLTRAIHITDYPEVMPLLKKSGCVGLEIGIESVDPETFFNINKLEDIEILRKAGQLQKKHNMFPLYTFMSLNPGETILSYYSQAKFIDELLEGIPWYKHFHSIDFPVYIGQFCTPHVGTQLYKDAPKLGVILAKGWQDYNHHTINFIPNSLLNDVPKKQIKRLKLDDYIVITKATWAWVYNLHPFKQPYLLQVKERIEFIKILSEFFIRCDGRLSLKEIVSNLAEYLNISYEKALKYCIVYTIILSQLGLIRSGLYNIDEDIKLKKIRIPNRFISRLKYSILLIIGKINLKFI